MEKLAAQLQRSIEQGLERLLVMIRILTVVGFFAGVWFTPWPWKAIAFAPFWVAPLLWLTTRLSAWRWRGRRTGGTLTVLRKVGRDLPSK